MSLITLPDVQSMLPQLAITPTSQPSDAQVAEIISVTESEVQALSAACFAPWPSDVNSVAGQFVRSTILEGVKLRVLRAKFAFSAPSQTPPEIGLSAEAYKDGIKRICDMAKALRENTPATAGDFVPVVGWPANAPTDRGTFAEYTLARNIIGSRGGFRGEGLHPWPL